MIDIGYSTSQNSVHEQNQCHLYEVNLILPPQPVYIVTNWLAGVIRTAYNTMPLLIYKV